MTETIVAAAVRHNGLTFSMPAPARHHNILRAMTAAGLPLLAGTPENQGFISSTGRFLDRWQAANVAQAAAQVTNKNGPADVLFSEDVW